MYCRQQARIYTAKYVTLEYIKRFSCNST